MLNSITQYRADVIQSVVKPEHTLYVAAGYDSKLIEDVARLVSVLSDEQLVFVGTDNTKSRLTSNELSLVDLENNNAVNFHSARIDITQNGEMHSVLYPSKPGTLVTDEDLPNVVRLI